MNFKLIIILICSLFLTSAFVSGLPWFYFMGISSIVVVTALFIKQPRRFLFLLLFFRAAIDPLLIKSRFSVGGIDLGLGGSLSLLLIAGALMSLAASPWARRAHQPIVLLWVILCIINAAAFFYTPDKAAAVKTLIRYSSILSLIVLTLIHVGSEDQVRSLVKWVLSSGLLAIFVGLFLISFFSVKGRFAATLGHPNILAFYLLILIGCFFSGFGMEFKGVLSIGFPVAFFSALLFTQTRSGWVALLVMVLMYGLFFKPVILLPSLLFFSSLFFIPIVRKPIENIFVMDAAGITINPLSSFGWRLEKWEYLWEAFLRKPFFGHGIQASATFGKDSLGAHNDYLRFLVEYGVVGLVFAYLPFVYVFFSAIADTRNQASLIRRQLAMFIVIFIPSFLVMSFSENLASYTVIHWYLWAVIAAYFSLKWNPGRRG